MGIFAFVSALVLAVLFLIHKSRRIEQAPSLPSESESATGRTSILHSTGAESTALAAKGDQVLMVTF